MATTHSWQVSATNNLNNHGLNHPGNKQVSARVFNQNIVSVENHAKTKLTQFCD